MLTSLRHVESADILVVDDDRDTAETMAQWLKLMGHNVQIARDGYQAIEIARRQRPRHVLLDLGLPGLDGYQVASRLRQELAGPIVVIAITGYGREEDRRRAHLAGFDHHFLKPIDHGALITLLSASDTGPATPLHAGPQPRATDREERPMLSYSRCVEITNALGFHLRAADKFVRLAQQFRAEVQVAYDGQKVSGRSILDLMVLAAPCGSRLDLETDGPEAEAAMNALTGLIGSRFGEEE